MIELILTLDYEIYGNGCGGLAELVLEPTLRLAEILKSHKVNMVVFAEALEFGKIQDYGTDPLISDVNKQIRNLFHDGHEIGLHIHPWWYNGKPVGGGWNLEWNERNICALPYNRILEMVRYAIGYLRRAIGNDTFTPISSRNGLWAMMPTPVMARVLAESGIRIESSVFKGGLTGDIGLDYRRSLRNGYYWRFQDDVNVFDPVGKLIEIPIYSSMVPFWSMLGNKRLAITRKAVQAGPSESPKRRRSDFLRFRYPRKMDFCRMHRDELLRTIKQLQHADRASPQVYKPVVLIGHSKDLVDFETVDNFISQALEAGIRFGTFATALKSIASQETDTLSPLENSK